MFFVIWRAVSGLYMWVVVGMLKLVDDLSARY